MPPAAAKRWTRPTEPLTDATPTGRLGSVVRSRNAGVWRLAARLHRSPDASEIVIEDAPQRCAWNRLQVLLHTLLDTDEEDADG